MRLRSLRLRHFRGVDERTVRFATAGVTVVSGPNEVGKSSILEALGLLFDVYDSSTRREVTATQPAGRDVSTEIEAEIEVGQAVFRYLKRFHREQGTELEELRPRMRRHVGRQAHERALQLLGEGIDVELWRALRVQQGSGWQQACLADQASLLAALGGAKGREDEELAELAAREACRYRTARRGDATGELRAAAAQEAELRAERDALEDELSRQQRDLRRAEELAEIEQRRSGALEDARALHDAAERRRHELERVADERARREAEGEAARRRAADLSRLAETTATLDELQRAAVDAAGERRRLADAAAAAEGRCSQARRGHELARARAASVLTALDRISQRILGAGRVDGAVLAELRERHTCAREARAASAASAAKLALRAVHDTQLRLDDGTHQLRAGEQLTHEFAAEAVLVLPDVEVTVHAGDDAAVCAARHDAAERALAAALADAGAEDMDHAQQLHERHEQARHDHELVRRLRASLGLPEGERAVEPGGASAAPVAADAARAAAEAAAADLARAAVRRRDAEEDANGARQALRRADDALDVASVRQEQAAVRARELRERLGGAVPPDDLLCAAIRAQREAEALLSALAAAEAAPAALAEQVERCQSLREAADAAAEALRDCRSERLTLQGVLQARGADGLFERAQRAASEWSAANDRLVRVQQAAEAAQLLSATLARARAQVRSDYAAPLRTSTVELGRMVFGPDFDVELDEQLNISHRLLHGLSLPFDQLSTGAQEQLAVIARLACATVVGHGAGAPLILDDAFGYADPQRLASVNEVLRKAGRDAQVIVLTCNAERFGSIADAHHVEMR